jgi:hypothetical protein
MFPSMYSPSIFIFPVCWHNRQRSSWPFLECRPSKLYFKIPWKYDDWSFHYGSKFPAVTITVFTTILEQNRKNCCQISAKCQKHFIISHFNLPFFHNFPIFSLFYLIFFYIEDIFSLFDLPFFHIFQIISLVESDKIWKIWKKGKSNNDKIWKIWKKDKLNSEMIR